MVMHFVSGLSGLFGAKSAKPFRQHSLVRLTRDFQTIEGGVASGTIGTVLEVLDDGRTYLVEFEGEHDTPEFVGREILTQLADV